MSDTISGRLRRWDYEPVEMNVSLRPTQRWAHISDVVYYGMARDPSGAERPLRVFFPTRDRRKARRVARRLHLRFRRTNGYYDFYEGRLTCTPSTSAPSTGARR